MPADYKYDLDTGMLRTRLWGKVTDEDLICLTLAVAKDSIIKPPIRELIDLSEAEQFDVTANSMRYVAQQDLNYPEKFQGLQAAIVAPTNFLYGMARMYELIFIAKGSPREIHVFRDYQEALTWLSGVKDKI